MFKKHICLVAGGAGFIGSHLVDRLLHEEYAVVCIDNLVTGKTENIDQVLKHPDFTFIEHDLTTPLPSQVLDFDIRFIFHLASPASPISFQKLAKEIALVNSVGTMHLLDLAIQKNAKFVFASTSEVYGKAQLHPQKEDYWGNVNPIGARSCYDESKRFGEMMVMLYIKKYGADARIVRIFNTYGPRMAEDDGRVVSIFVSRAMRGLSIQVHGKGDQTRSFCFVSDLVDGLTKAIFTGNTKGEVVNLGNPGEKKVLDLAKQILEMTGSKSQIIYDELPSDDPERRNPDITKAKSLLGWSPKVPLEEGLRQTIEYYKSRIL